jgi:diaminopimelate epimerase
MSPDLTSVPFVKVTACGNDFLIIDGMYAPADIAAFSRRICDRHAGVGADGVEWLFPPQDKDDDVDVRARLFNADGSEAEISGNGTRCVAAHIASEQRKENVVVRTGAGVKACHLTAYNGMQYEFEIAMGEPQVGEVFPIKLAFGEVRGIPVSMGNPHYVVFVKEHGAGWQAEASEIGRHHDFKHGINVEFVVTKDRSNLEARFFERGVGETQSSGTGSCASAVAAIATQRAESPLRVHAPGGVQTVRWQEQVFLRGPAQIICRGEFFV